jgi:phosphonate transport system substrate-binding protein
LIPEHNVFRQLDRYRPLFSYLSRRTDIDLEMQILPRYGNIIDNFASAQMDGAFFGSFTYAMAHTRVGVEPLARPVSTDGASTYYGMLFVRRDSGITNAADMKDKTFVFVDEATTAGYLLPLDYFFSQGVEDYRDHLGEFYFAGTHEGALYDVLRGVADAGAAKNTVFERLAKSDPALESDLVVLARSPDVPENGLALKHTVAPSIRSRLGEALLSMHDDDEGRAVLQRFGALRFIETSHEDYESVFRYAAEIDLELATYEYQND